MSVTMLAPVDPFLDESDYHPFEYDRMPRYAAHYSPVAPVSFLRIYHKHLRSMSGHNDIKLEKSRYQLLIAPDVNKNLVHMSALAREAKHVETWILDNGVIETGTSLPALALLSIYDAVRIMVPEDKDVFVVAPDVIGDGVATFAQVLAMLELRPAIGNHMLAVVQGETPLDMINCVNIMRQLPIFGWCVPRWVANKFGSRRWLIDYIAAVDNRPVHMLGMSRNFYDDMECTKLCNVMGIDSANPLVAAWTYKRSLADAHHFDRKDYWESLDAAVTEDPLAIGKCMHLIDQNIDYVLDKLS